MFTELSVLSFCLVVFWSERHPASEGTVQGPAVASVPEDSIKFHTGFLVIKEIIAYSFEPD